MSDTDILLLALESEAASQRTIEHLLTCGSCNARVANLRRVVADLAAREDRFDTRGPSCLDESALSRLIDGDADTSAAHEEIAHLAGCAHCRSELGSLAALLADPEVACAKRSASPSIAPRSARAKFLGALAAAAVLLLLAWPGAERRARSNGAHRAPTIAALGSPKALSPDGDVGAATEFSWTAAPGSDRYRLTLYDRSGHVVYETQVTDTTAALPDSVILTRGVPYVWQVDARTGLDRWTSSEAAEFVLVAPRKPR